MIARRKLDLIMFMVSGRYVRLLRSVPLVSTYLMARMLLLLVMVWLVKVLYGAPVCPELKLLLVTLT